MTSSDKENVNVAKRTVSTTSAFRHSIVKQTNAVRDGVEYRNHLSHIGDLKITVKRLTLFPVMLNYRVLCTRTLIQKS